MENIAASMIIASMVTKTNKTAVLFFEIDFFKINFLLEAPLLVRTAQIGDRAVDFLSNKLVCNMYSVPFDKGSSRPTSAHSALNASIARSVCDICTVVRGGSRYCATRTT